MEKPSAMVRWALFGSLALTTVCSFGGRPARPVDPTVRPSTLHGPFYVRSFTGKCLRYGFLGDIEMSNGEPVPATPTIFMDVCPGPLPAPPALRVIAHEINARHEILLRVGDKVIGVRAPVQGMRLELQDPVNSANQRWAFDGDSLILASDRTLVAEVKNARTPRGTAIVLGSRDLDDSEFWSFVAVDGSDAKPTDGFKRVTEAGDLQSKVEAGWGTVIEIPENVSIPMDGFPLQVPEGVTIRGDRRGTRLGPQLYFEDYPARESLMEIKGDHVRITGLRVSGPSTTKEGFKDDGRVGIVVDDREGFASTILDHNELWGWTHAAIKVNGWWGYDEERPCDDAKPNWPRNVQVVRNFIHDNIRGGAGYGVGFEANAFAHIVGNTFVYNRHQIAATGYGLAGYRALFNLVTSGAPGYGGLGNKEHDFDMHGTECGSHHTGGHAGADVEIVRNTFLGTNRRNYDLRGVPCGHHRFNFNVTRQSAGGAVRWSRWPLTDSYPCGAQLSLPDTPPPWMQISSNRFESPDPTSHLGVGDFDGDGRQDLFLATGASWYYAPAGQAEWRFLRNESGTMDNLLFGDVDGDGRTDVLIREGRDWLVSWAGASKREKINESDGPIADFAVGDFNGDRRADLLRADGARWTVSYGGLGPFTTYEPTGIRVRDLRFGDFNADRKTDVFAVFGGYWMVRYGGTPGFSRLRTALGGSIAGLVVADFDGNGRADVAFSGSATVGRAWFVSYDGTGNPQMVARTWINVNAAAAVGMFDGEPGADALDWHLVELENTVFLDIASSGRSQARYSRTHMR